MPKKASAPKTTFGGDLIEGMKLVLAHQHGKIELEQVWPKPIDVKAIRKRVKMSQAEFSRTYRISKRALQECFSARTAGKNRNENSGLACGRILCFRGCFRGWEQGGRQPDSAARAYLTVISKEPLVVRRTLAGE
jgi:DNA-binding transcriptional regulator YiaG